MTEKSAARRGHQFDYSSACLKDQAEISKLPTRFLGVPI